jgi:hypothetical protein
MWGKTMQLVKRLFQRKDFPVNLPELPSLQPPDIEVPDTKSQLASFRAYDNELKTRMRMLEIDADVLGRHIPRESV